MSSYGVVPTGFAVKSLHNVMTEIEEAQRALINPGLNQKATGIIGQLNGIFSKQVHEGWEVAHGIYRTIDVDSAEGEALDLLCALVGIKRLPATHSSAVLTLTLAENTTVPLGRVVSTAGNPDARWITKAAVTSTDAGTYTVLAEAQNTGEQIGLTGTLTVIETPVSGWTAVTNATDAQVGRQRENDTQLRQRRAQSLATQGTGTMGALQAKLRALSNVLEVRIIENDDDVMIDGIPPHAFEAIVRATSPSNETVENAIAQVIWDNKPLGIRAHGSDSGEAIDINGDIHEIAFTYPDAVRILVEVTVEVDERFFPEDGEEQIQAALAAYGDTLNSGDDVVLTRLYAPVYGVSGVTNVTVIEIAIHPAAPAAADIPISIRQIASIDSADVDVTVVPI